MLLALIMLNVEFHVVCWPEEVPSFFAGIIPTGIKMRMILVIWRLILMTYWGKKNEGWWQSSSFFFQNFFSTFVCSCLVPLSLDLLVQAISHSLPSQAEEGISMNLILGIKVQIQDFSKFRHFFLSLFFRNNLLCIS